MSSRPQSNKSQSARRRAARGAVVRRLPTSGWPWLRHHGERLWRRLLELPWLWIVLFLVASTLSLAPRPLFFRPKLEPGTIAGRTFIAGRDLSVPDERATREARQRARQEVLPVYDLDRGTESIRRQQLAELFAAGRAMVAPAEEAKPGKKDGAAAVPVDDMVVRLEEVSGLELTADEIELLRHRGFSIEVEDRLSGILTRVLRQGVVSDKDGLLENRVRGITVRELPARTVKVQLDLYGYLDYPDQVRETVRQDLRSWDGLTTRERQAYGELVLANVAPNLTLNSSETLRLKDEAAAQFGTVFHQIKKGEVIVRSGDPVDDLAARAIAEMAGSRDVTGLLLTLAGTFLLLSASALILWLGIGHQRRADRSRSRRFSECLLLLTLSILGCRFAYLVAGALSNTIQREPFNSLESLIYGIPFGSLALVAVLLYGRDTALVLSVVFSLLVGRIAGGEAVWMTMVYSLAASLAAVYAVDPLQFKQRSATTWAGVVVGLVNGVAVVTLEALGGEIASFGRLGFEVVCGFVGGLLAAAVTSFSVPILETVLGITTHIKLVELANPNLPLLRRLALEAPGTFQHSLAVANLAKAGCEAIDADALLVNTGALYHDAGKVFRPRYFVENQVPGQNPHDKIQPSMSALILINHVKEGLELAREHKLPAPICDAIEQHHGTRLIKFFYNRAQERRERETEAVREEDFRYAGPKPQSKEMGVLMLADGVEAASRTLVEPSRQKIRTMLRALFDDCLRDGQLDQTDLTLGDLRRVEEAFLRVLTNIYHRRIDYPGFEFNREAPKKRPPDAASGAAGERRKVS